MPNYLTPGVYVEEIPAASKPIEGVGTSVAAFVGLAPGGPVNVPQRIANWSQFERTFSAPDAPHPTPFMEGAYLAHAVYGFFHNAGGFGRGRQGQRAQADQGGAGIAAARARRERQRRREDLPRHDQGRPPH